MADKKRNMYSCFQCERNVVTEEPEDADPPVFTGCIFPGCDGLMHSHQYNKVDAFNKAPEAEWREPTDQEYGGLPERDRRRVDQGGLALFLIKNQRV